MEVKIDIKKEVENIPHLVELSGDWILVSNIKEKYAKMSRDDLFLEVEKLHRVNEEKFSRIKNYYQKLWDKVGMQYIEEMEKIMGCDLGENKIVYIVPSLWVNIADVIGRKNAFIVAEEVQQNPLDFIFLHELTHLYYSDILEVLKLREAGASPLMEGVAHLILFKSSIKKLFSGIRYYDVSFVKKNPEFMKRLKSLFDNRKDFKGFLGEAIKLNKEIGGDVVL